MITSHKSESRYTQQWMDEWRSAGEPRQNVPVFSLQEKDGLVEKEDQLSTFSTWAIYSLDSNRQSIHDTGCLLLDWAIVWHKRQWYLLTRTMDAPVCSIQLCKSQVLGYFPSLLTSIGSESNFLKMPLNPYGILLLSPLLCATRLSHKGLIFRCLD